VTLDRNASNRILLIAYHFPPSAEVGGTRMANFAKWLPSCGWQPYVLTIRDKHVERMDPDRLRDLEGVGIDKVRVLPTLVDWYGAVKARLAGPQRHTPLSEAGFDSRSGPDRYRGEALSRKLKRYLLSFLIFPDYQRGWIMPAIPAAIRQLRRYGITWIMTSCPPYSGHLIGLAVKMMAGVKWIADFRDPWMTTGWKRAYPTCALSMRVEAWLERKVIEKADLLLFNVERLRNAYRERYAHVPGQKFVFIPNGIAPHALAETAEAEKYERFTLSYTGALYVGRSPEPVFEAVSRLIRKGKVAAEAIRIKLVGQCRTVDGVPTDSLIRKHGLESSVEVCDPVPYADAMAIISRSHLALLLAPQLPYQIPAKAYDYLGTGVRILAVAEDGATSDLIRDTGSGRAFASGNIDGIEAFIHEEMTRRGSATPGRRAGLARFDARRITEELAGHLDRVARMAPADAPAADARYS
jgi:glycosyltransferase involved in cell wall biosynthesis